MELARRSRSIRGRCGLQVRAPGAKHIPHKFVAPVIGAFGLGLAISAISNIDGDAVNATVGAWQPQRDSAGAATAAPAMPLVGDVVNCPGSTQPATIGDGQVTNCSADNIF